VFVSDDKWMIHCGEVKNREFQEGRMVSAYRDTLTLKLINQKLLGYGSMIKKVSSFISPSKALFQVFRGDQSVFKTTQKRPRLNRTINAQNWLSMQPNP
jgi:hypothetical protein